MDLPSLLGLAAVLLLVVANGFFVATEFSLVAVRRSRIEQLAVAGSSRAIAARDVLDHLDTYIAACQFGITLSSLALGWLGEPALAHLIEGPIGAVVGDHASTAVAHSVAIAISFAIITSLHIVLGELAPKGLALQRAETTALWVARPLQAFYAVFRWPIQLLNAIGNGTLKIFGLEPASGHEMVHSVEELRMLVTGMQRAGVVEESEARIAARAFRFADMTAASLMTPRTEMDSVPLASTREELLTYAREGRHSRLPVYEKTTDEILGVLHVRDLFKVLDAPFDLRGLIRPVLLVPETKPADDLLDEMRATGRQFAVVIDEYGGTAGVVTMGNLFEGLVGGFIDDESPSNALPTPEPVQPDGVHLLDGLTRLPEVEETLAVRLEDEDLAASETIGGLVMTRLGRIPELGDEVAVDGWRLRVEEKDGMRVSVVRATKVTIEDEETADSANGA